MCVARRLSAQFNKRKCTKTRFHAHCYRSQVERLSKETGSCLQINYDLDEIEGEHSRLASGHVFAFVPLVVDPCCELDHITLPAWASERNQTCTGGTQICPHRTDAQSLSEIHSCITPVHCPISSHPAHIAAFTRSILETLHISMLRSPLPTNLVSILK